MGGHPMWKIQTTKKIPENDLKSSDKAQVLKRQKGTNNLYFT